MNQADVLVQYKRLHQLQKTWFPQMLGDVPGDVVICLLEDALPTHGANIPVLSEMRHTKGSDSVTLTYSGPAMQGLSDAVLEERFVHALRHAAAVVAS
jgi:hypothetical protein